MTLINSVKQTFDEIGHKDKIQPIYFKFEDLMLFNIWQSNISGYCEWVKVSLWASYF